MRERVQSGPKNKAGLVAVVCVVLVQTWACSPIDLTDEPGAVDASVASKEEVSSRQEPAETTERTAATPLPKPRPTPKPADTSEPQETSGSAPMTTSERGSSERSEAGAHSSDSSDALDPPVPAECLSTAVEATRPGPEGFAAVAGFATDTTVGGAGGEVVYVSGERGLREHLTTTEPRVVVVCGEITLSARLPVTSNKTLIGVGPSSVVRGGIDVRGTAGGYVSNVIITNLVLDPSLVPNEGEDTQTGIRLEYAHHVWLDHLEIYNAPWGLIDVVWGSDLVTLSWNKLHFTQDFYENVEQRFAIRVGDTSDSSVLERDGEKLRITLHHNWFGEHIRQRIPRVAYGQVHVFNNFYSVTNNDTAIWGLSQYAEVLVEANYFQRTHRPHDIPPTSEVTNDELAQIVAIDNVYYGVTGARTTRGAVFTPPYEMERDSVVWLPSLVPWGAGPHASLEPKPPWSDAGVVAPEDQTTGETSAGVMSESTDVMTVEPTFDSSTGDTLDAGAPDNDASVEGVFDD